MFRLISLSINDWNYLGHIPNGKLIFVPNEEEELTNLPYSTVLIGSNGTGKSTLLSYIAKIFEDLKFIKVNGKRKSNAIKFPYSICYKLGQKKYQITQNYDGIDLNAFKEGKRVMKWNYIFTINDKSTETKWSEIELPEKVIAVSYLPMDRFRQKRNFSGEFYQYLGLRHRSNAASPQYFLNNTLPLLFSHIAEGKSVKFLKDILNFMEVDKTYLGIQLKYRYKKYFFTGKLTSTEFQELFENSKKFSKREGTSYAVEYYERYVKKEKRLINRIVTYLNIRTQVDNIGVGEKSLLEFNLFDNLELIEELNLIYHLQKLDLLSSASLIFKKSTGNPINSQDLSSGEFHFLITMIAIQATINSNSLVLIDEPDTSLHPNWQMKYVQNLKDLFKKWNSTHFVIATHSHFIVSDLEGESSEVIVIRGSTPNLQVASLNLNTYGWSPDEILYKVFGLRTVRNHFFEYDLLQLANQLNSEQKDLKIIRELTNKFSKFTFSKEDPLNKLIQIANEYLNRLS